MNQPPLIALHGITKTYSNGEVAVEVLHGISLTIEAGEFVAIMGASGSGKSTLMNILGCLDRPTTGTYRFDGEDVSALDADDLALLRRDAFGFIFQSYNLLPTATAIENVEIPAIYAGLGAAERQGRAAALLSALGLEERLDHRPNQLSGGQQQRVSIARALMNGGPVILADEPTGALDSRSGAEVMALLAELNRQGHTIIVITHDPQVAAHADRVIELRDGMIVADTIAHEGEHRQALRQSALPGKSGLLGEVAEAATMALRALRANLFRTVLTLLGIVIGVGSVVTMLAVGEGAQQAVLAQIGKMGTNLLLVRPGSPTSRGGSDARLMPEDAEEIAKLPNVVAAVPEMTGNVTIRYGNLDYQSQANATSPGMPVARDWPVAHGLFVDAADLRAYAPVAVLGSTIVRELFSDGTDPVGKYVLLNNVPFQVIGVMSEKGASQWGSDLDDVVFVPLTTGSLRLFGQRFVRSITVLVDDLSRIAETEQAIKDLLIQRHRAEDFRIRNMASVLETATETQGTLTMLLGAVAAISLLVGGIGVMNIMLVSVTERTREIGIRMATGARAGNILQQFMTEAAVVACLGGAVGVAGGLAVGYALQAWGTPIRFTLPPVMLAFGCAFATGVIFGFMPARKAARLDPVVALGAE